MELRTGLSIVCFMQYALLYVALTEKSAKFAGSVATVEPIHLNSLIRAPSRRRFWRLVHSNSAAIDRDDFIE